MDSDTDSNVSCTDGPTEDQVPPLPLFDECYMIAWVPELVMCQVVGAALLRAYFMNEEGQKVLTYVPTKAMWYLARAEKVKRSLATSNLWRFFKLKPWGLG